MIEDTDIEQLDKALYEESPSESHLLKDSFEKAFPIIEKHIERKVKLKVVLDLFNRTCNTDVSLARFRQLLRAERAKAEEIQNKTLMGSGEVQ